MSQSVVTIRLNGHPYKIGCGAGEEDHVAKLGSEVEAVMQSLIASVGQIGEARLLAMVALILADRAAAPSTSNSHSDAETRVLPIRPQMMMQPPKYWKMPRCGLPRLHQSLHLGQQTRK